MATKDELGRRGEELATRWAEARGWVVLDRNWRGSRGELDLVAQAGDTVVVAEVKTRRTTAQGHPAEAVTPEKVRRLRRLAGEWLEQQGQHGTLGQVPQVRIDVLAILWPASGGPLLSHLEGVS